MLINKANSAITFFNYPRRFQPHVQTRYFLHVRLCKFNCSIVTSPVPFCEQTFSFKITYDCGLPDFVFIMTSMFVICPDVIGFRWGLGKCADSELKRRFYWRIKALKFLKPDCCGLFGWFIELYWGRLVGIAWGDWNGRYMMLRLEKNWSDNKQDQKQTDNENVSTGRNNERKGWEMSCCREWWKRNMNRKEFNERGVNKCERIERE